MIHVAPSPVLQERSSRAPFKYPVRVTIAGERVVRLLSGDLSPTGMFLKMDDPPEAGTVVVLAFEAGGRVLPFAEGEVAWTRRHERGGFGVRFTRFLHPRAQALIEHLSEGGPYRPLPARRRTVRFGWLSAAAAIAVALIAAECVAPGPVETVDPSVACRTELVEPVVSVAPAPETPLPPPPAPVKKPASRRARAAAALPQGPKAEPATLARTVSSAAQPGRFTSTPLPSGAARLVNVSRVSGAVRVAIEPVAGGHVTAVTSIASPPRLVIDVAGTAPSGLHSVPLSDPELERVAVSRNGQGTRLIFTLTRAPAQVAQHGDTALVSY